MVISSLTGDTAKTVATLAHNLNLAEYENIIILDDDGRKCWCKFEMMKMRLQHKINFILLQVPPFNVWDDVHYLFGEYYNASSPQRFYSLIAAKQYEDNLFFHFRSFLHLLHQKKPNALIVFAVPIRDLDRFNRITSLTWWDWFKCQSNQKLKMIIRPE